MPCSHRFDDTHGTPEIFLHLQAQSEAVDSSEYAVVSGVNQSGQPVVCISVARIDRIAQDIDMVVLSLMCVE